MEKIQLDYKVEAFCSKCNKELKITDATDYKLGELSISVEPCECIVEEE